MEGLGCGACALVGPCAGAALPNLRCLGCSAAAAHVFQPSPPHPRLPSTPILPSSTAPQVLDLNPDGVFFSNGPGDPSAVPYAVENAKKILGKKPAFGICMGHQARRGCGCYGAGQGQPPRGGGCPGCPDASGRMRALQSAPEQAPWLCPLAPARSQPASHHHLPPPAARLLQVIGQALGGKTFKLKFGHHGGNHPLRHTPTGARCTAGLGRLQREPALPRASRAPCPVPGRR